MKTYKGLITSLLENQVFVFGSNPEGRHGGGAARVAANKFYAVMGNGRGMQGQSYGLVTKNLTPNFKEESTGITYVDAGERSVNKTQIFRCNEESRHGVFDSLLAFTKLEWIYT